MAIVTYNLFLYNLPCLHTAIPTPIISVMFATAIPTSFYILEEKCFNIYLSYIGFFVLKATLGIRYLVGVTHSSHVCVRNTIDLWCTYLSPFFTTSCSGEMKSNYLHAGIIMRGTVIIVLLYFPSNVIKVCSQTIPYISFMGNSLPNHSYVDLSLVGENLDGSNSVQCHTDLTTCCNATQGSDRGDWYFPNKMKLPFSGGTVGAFERRNAQQVDLCRRGNTIPPEGIYRCDIETSTTSDNSREVLYVGLYQHNNKGQYMYVHMCTTCAVLSRASVTILCCLIVPQ